MQTRALRYSLVCTFLAVVCLLTSQPAHGAVASLTVDDADAVLARSDDGSRATSVGFTNLTDARVRLRVVPSAGGSCQPTLDKSGELQPARHRDFKVTIPSACKIEDDRFEFTIEATPPTTPASFAINAAAAPKDDPPNWGHLWAFLILLAVLSLATALGYLCVPGRGSAWELLPHLEEAWSFKDSWVSNITIGGGLLTGLFGSSEVVKTFLGEGADAATALSSVGAAVAVVFVGVGSIALLALKSPSGNAYTTLGLLVAAVITLAGAMGELWVVYVSAREVTGGALRDVVLPTTLILVVPLLLGYAVSSLYITIKTGTTPPPDKEYAKPPLTEAVFAASMIVEAMNRNSAKTRRDVADDATRASDEPRIELRALLDSVQAFHEPEPKARPARRRAASAML